ncbi:MAG TPA: hypothetical protein VK826_00830, partial [Bacteroidia bacterium]|nr:hypothetical protein [Bacteroidia bacterium]
SELGGQLTQTDGWYMRRSNPVDTVRQPLNSRIVAIGLTVGAGIRLEFWRTLAVCFETDFFASVNYYRHKKNTGIETGKYGDFDFNQVRTLGVSCRF